MPFFFSRSECITSQVQLGIYLANSNIPTTSPSIRSANFSVIHSDLFFQRGMRYTSSNITHLCNINLNAVERCIVILFGSNINLERRSSQWWESKGKYYAKWVLSGKHLSGQHLVNARKICSWHSEQLAKLANEAVAKQETVTPVVVEAVVVEDPSVTSIIPWE